jgi:hypothetical protein
MNTQKIILENMNKIRGFFDLVALKAKKSNNNTFILVYLKFCFASYGQTVFMALTPDDSYL